MLELPESMTISRQLHETVQGRTIVGVQAAQSPHGFAWYSGDPADYPKLFKGKEIGQVNAVGGYVEIYAQNTRILLNDGVNIRHYSSEEKLPPKHQLFLELDDGSAIVCTVQMYGGLQAFLEGTHDNFYYTVAHEKPSPLTEAFDEEYFEELLSGSSPKLSAKAFLATEQRIPGLGNGTLQDILFHAQIHPKTKLSALQDKQLQTMFSSVKSVLSEMALQGGRNTEKDLFGTPGGYQTKLSSKTWKKPCSVCAGEIERKAYLGGNIYFCAHCQPL